MAHTENGIITAEEAREIADLYLTEGLPEDELKERYRIGLKEIEQAAEAGAYGVALTVPSSLMTEWTELITAQGFRQFQNSTTPEGGRVVTDRSEDQTLEAVEVNWSTFEFTQTATTLQRPNYIELLVRVEGYPFARNLYYTLTGTLTSTDFLNNLSQGEIAFDPITGVGGILIEVDPGGSRVGKTVQALVYYDSARETLLHAFNEITVIV